MKNILAIGASNSSTSINKALASYIANKVEDAEVNQLDWNEMILPLYGTDLEEASGIPENAHKFLKMIADSDAIVLSLAEHNGLPSAAFKNLWDWTSRIEKNFWADKPMFLAATSPGARGGLSVLSTVKNMAPHFGANLITDFSLPSFYENFKEGKMVDEEIATELSQKLQLFQESI